jgi:hypothetical protein
VECNVPKIGSARRALNARAARHSHCGAPAGQFSAAIHPERRGRRGVARKPWKGRARLLGTVAAATALGIIVGYLLLQVTILRWSTG